VWSQISGTRNWKKSSDHKSIPHNITLHSPSFRRHTQSLDFPLGETFVKLEVFDAPYLLRINPRKGSGTGFDSISYQTIQVLLGREIRNMGEQRRTTLIGNQIEVE
jgi:hypothetical protein